MTLHNNKATQSLKRGYYAFYRYMRELLLHKNWTFDWTLTSLVITILMVSFAACSFDRF